MSAYASQGKALEVKMDRIRALDYLQKTGMQIPEAMGMVNAVIKMGGGGYTVELSTSGPGLAPSSVKIDAAAVANAKSILRGLRAIEAEARP